ncbi:MAG: histidine triad nucleotide-binding protein [Verrucomicrobiota bacterium]
MIEKSLFEKIVDREISAEIVYEDNLSLAFKDISPQAPKHLLIIPKKRYNRIAEVPESEKSLLGHLLIVAAKVAMDAGIEDSGYRVIINNGKDGGESIPHLHLHVVGGRPLSWPPG